MHQRPTIEELRRSVRVDAETGKLFWLRGRLAGKEAFATQHVGYRRGKLKGRSYYAHCIVFALVHGRWSEEVDHDNQDKSDNRPANLIERSHRENMRNQPIRSSNTSGVMGVCWNTRQRRWVARIQGDAGRVFIGSFKSLDEAVAARRAAESRLGYHPNHGLRAA